MLISAARLSHCLFMYFQIRCDLSEPLPLPSLPSFLIEDMHTEDALRNSIMAVEEGPPASTSVGDELDPIRPPSMAHSLPFENPTMDSLGISSPCGSRVCCSGL